MDGTMTMSWESIGKTYLRDTEALLDTIDVGDVFLDFMALDEDADSMSLSALIAESDYTLIDFWTVNCNSCITQSQAIHAEYNELSEKSFDVVAVIGNLKNRQRYESIMWQQGYPWTVLADYRIGKQRGIIWELYGIPRVEGLKVLVNQSGTVLMINPSVADIIAIVG